MEKLDEAPPREATDWHSSTAVDVSLQTVLICDLVDSTALVEKMGDSHASELLVLHDRRARDLLARFGGREIDKSDGFLLLFDRPSDAVEWALAYHRELAELSRQIGSELRARVGIHLGEVFLHENSPEDIARGAKPLEVEGLAKPIAARVMALAAGGQTLLTQGAFDLAQRAMALELGELRCLRHGTYALKGLPNPLELFEIGEAGLAPLKAPPGSRRALWWRRGAAALLLLLIVLAATTFLYRERYGGPGQRPAVAVLGFRNGSEQAGDAWLSTALAELLTVELAAGESLRLIPGESVSRMKLELGLTEIDSLSDETLAAVRHNLGTDYVVVGSFLVIELAGSRQLVLTSVLQSALNGEMMAASRRDGDMNELLDLVSQVGASLRADLGAGRISDTQARAVRATLSSNPEAARLYFEGLEKLRRFDATGAREVLERAVEVDRGYALAHAALSQAWAALGYDRRAEQSARRAFELRQGLPREEVLLIEGRYFQASVQHQKAIRSYQALRSFFPDDVEYGLLLAEAQWQAGSLTEAMETLTQLRALPDPMGGDPRIDLIEAWVRYHRSEHRLELAAAQRAVGKGREQQARILVAEALFRRGVALFRLGHFGEAEPALEESHRMFLEVGDRGKAAQVLNAQAVLLFNQGDTARAGEIYSQALEILRQTGDRKWVSTVLNNRADLLRHGGDLAAAKEVFEESLAIVREIDDSRREPVRLRNLGLVLLQQGKLEEAESTARAGLTAARKVGSQHDMAVSAYVLGGIAFARGRLDEARARYDEALAALETIDARRSLSMVVHGQGRLLAAAGDFDGALERFDSAAAIRAERGERSSLAVTRLARAEVVLALGRPAEAESLAREARSELAHAGWRDDELLAESVMARALLALGELPAARQVLEAAGDRASRSQSPEVRLRYALATAQVDLAGGEREAARRRAAAVRREATEFALAGVELEARLVLARSEGSPKADAALAADARAAGFEWIARQAEAGEADEAPGGPP